MVDVVEKIKDVIKEKVRPALVMDGGNIEFIEYTEDKVVKVKLLGACKGCPLSAITLKNMVEETIKEYVPEIKEVQNIEFNENDGDELEF